MTTAIDKKKTNTFGTKMFKETIQDFITGYDPNGANIGLNLLLTQKKVNPATLIIQITKNSSSKT